MSVRIMVCDVLEGLAKLESDSVHCVVTSPPYWGLRDYSADGQLGLEPTPGKHVRRMVEVFREVRRVLRADGTLWLNYGDCYYSQGERKHGGWNASSYAGGTNPQKNVGQNAGNLAPHATLKPKDLVGMPWRIAFALQRDGWYLRSDVIWAKPNPMPESVTDRPTKSHEHVFLLTKNARYFYDADAVREPALNPGKIVTGLGSTKDFDPVRQRRKPRGERVVGDGCNIRDVWTIATAPFPGAHFATFPPKLVEPCIKAGTSEHGCCAECGAPCVRQVERGESSWERRKADGDPVRYGLLGTAAPLNRSLSDAKDRAAGGFGKPATRMSTGWIPTCACCAPIVPCRVFDPFGGAGTVGLVADRLGRDAILIELNSDYAKMAEQRIRNDCPLFTKVEIE